MRKETKEKTIKIIFHILAWSVILVLPIHSAIRFRMGSNFLVTYYIFMSINVLIFYTNYLVLVPVLFFQKNRIRYYVSILALVFFFYFVSDFANEQIFKQISKIGKSDQLIRPPGANEGMAPRPPRLRPRIIIAVPNAHLLGYMSSSVFMIFLSLGLRLLERQSKYEKMQEEMENAKLNAELAFLKNQMSPHFFFNTLNNIYSLIVINQEDSQKAVLRLSKLMRYLLYETEQGNVSLSREIDFMSNYIDLMRLRMNEKVSLNVLFPEKYDDVDVPPLLFIPFIENAFKHGITNKGKPFINIMLTASEKALEFTCKNSVAQGGAEERQTGIGLENITKRLKLLFPGKHDLRIRRDNDKFEVSLTIYLS